MGLENITNFPYKLINNEGEPFLRIEPIADKSVASLKKWIEANLNIMRNALSTAGGLLFQGFDVKDARDFETVVSAIEPDLCKSHDFDDGARMWETEHIYQASLTSITKDKVPLSFHNEDAFVPFVPRTLMLCALSPAKFGGESIFADGRKVFESLPQDLKDKFLNRKIRSTFTTPDSTFLINTRVLKHEGEIRKIGKKYGAIDVVRVGDFHTKFTFEVPPVIQHEKTEKPIWFSRAHQAIPLSCIGDLWYGYKYRKNILSTLEGTRLILKIILQHIWYSLKGLFGSSVKNGEYVNECTFDNGDKISLFDQLRICAAYWKNATIVPLNAGDFVILDNLLVTHGRLHYKGERRLLSCIGSQVMVEQYNKTKSS